MPQPIQPRYYRGFGVREEFGEKILSINLNSAVSCARCDEIKFLLIVNLFTSRGEELSLFVLSILAIGFRRTSLLLRTFAALGLLLFRKENPVE